MNKINIKEFVANETVEIASKIKESGLLENSSIPKKIVFIRVGNDPASISYMKSKSKQLTDAGFEVQDILFDSCCVECNFNHVLNAINNANEDESVLGILVQSPVPEVSALSYHALINQISPEKDIDAFSDHYVAMQYETGSGKDTITINRWPCTPLGILHYLKKSGYNLAGKKVAIVGRSNIVGKPLALAMINAGAIVTVYNSNLPIDKINKELRTAGFNVVVGAIGRPQLIELQKDEDHPNAIENLEYVFDVGINRVSDEDDRAKYNLVGDIRIDDSISDIDFNYTAVPGGVGLLTRLGLLLRAKYLLEIKLNMLDIEG